MSVAAWKQRRLEAAYAGLIMLAIAVVFRAALGHSFLLSHDDADYVGSRLVQSPFFSSVIGAFKTPVLGAWAPLHLITVRLDRALWGNWAGGYVLGNLVLHALTASLAAWLLLRARANRIAAAVAGLLFAVHPVQVEAVAWIAQRKTVLSAAFFLLSLHAWMSYAKAAPDRKPRWYALSIAAGACALLSKPSAVVLPAALVLLDAPLGRLKMTRVWISEKIPFLLMAAAVLVVTVSGKTEVASLASETGHDRTVVGPLAWHGGSPLATLLTMVTVLPRYLGLIFWPVNLSVVYTPAIHTRVDLAVAASLALIAALAVAGVLLARRSPRVFFWYGLFFLGLLPVSQIVPQVTLMNDRYLYLSMVGAAALAGEGIASAWRHLAPSLRPILAGVAAAVLGVLAAQARARVPVWQNDLLLWSDAVSKAPRSPHAWYNFGRSLEMAQDTEDALSCYLKTIELDGRDGDAALNAGAIYLRRPDVDKAAPLLEMGAQLLPASEEGQFNLALLRFYQGRFEDAEPPLRAALRQDEKNCAARALLGHVLTLTDRPGDALDQYRDAIAQGCADAEVAFYRAYAQSERADMAGALATLDEAVPAAGKMGTSFLNRATLKPLKAQPRFDALLRLFARERSR